MTTREYLEETIKDLLQVQGIYRNAATRADNLGNKGEAGSFIRLYEDLEEDIKYYKEALDICG